MIPAEQWLRRWFAGEALKRIQRSDGIQLAIPRFLELPIPFHTDCSFAEVLRRFRSLHPKFTRIPVPGLRQDLSQIHPQPFGKWNRASPGTASFFRPTLAQLEPKGSHMRNLPKIAAALLGLALSACDRSEVTSTTPTRAPEGNVSVSVNLGQVGVLARALQMTPTRLILSFTSDESVVRDTIAISGSGTVLKSYNFASGNEWLYVEGRDQRDSVLYSGWSNFEVVAGTTTNVNVYLNALYSSLRVKYPVVDSLYRFTLSVDGANWGDSTVAQGTRRGDTVKMSHDYLSASMYGTEHLFSLKAWGRDQGKDTVLYALDTLLPIESGSNAGHGLNLKWVGSSRPGQASLSVVIGSVGQVVIQVGYGANPTDSLVTDTAPISTFSQIALDSARARLLYGVSAFANSSSNVTVSVPGGYVSMVASKIASDGTEGYSANVGMMMPLTVDWAPHDLTGLRTITFEYRNSDKITDAFGVQLMSDVYDPALVAAGTVYEGVLSSAVMLAPSTAWKTATIDVLDFATPTWWTAPADFPYIEDVLKSVKGLMFVPRTMYSASGTLNGIACTKCVSPTMTKQVLDIRNITLHKGW
jgi:hypothetical protein